MYEITVTMVLQYGQATLMVPAGVNNTFSYNTIENNWRAAAFGGGSHKAEHNYIIDTVGGSGIRMNTVFNNININGTGLDGITASRFSGPHQGSAIYTYTGNGSATFNNLTTTNIANPNLNYIQSGFNLTIQ